MVTNPADDLAWFRILRLHEGIGPVLARRVIETLRIADPDAFGRWPEAAAALPPRSSPAVSNTVGQLAAAAGQERTADCAVTILAALREPLAARYADAAVRFADLARLAGQAPARPAQCH